MLQSGRPFPRLLLLLLLFVVGVFGSSFIESARMMAYAGLVLTNMPSFAWSIEGILMDTREGRNDL